MRKGSTMMIIHYEDGSRQVIKPKMQGENRFDGDWYNLCQHITKGNHVSFDIA